MENIFENLILLLINFITNIGYFGIFIGMFLESTIVPIPSELIMIPAGFAASQGLMNLYLILLFGILGNVLGAIFSYYVAIYWGRPVIFKIGKYFFLNKKNVEKIENFFKLHGEISIFTARLIPGFRHFISLPAGIARMNIYKFSIYTFIGSSLWTTILTILGFYIGKNQNLINQYLELIIVAVLILCILLVFLYYWFNKGRTRK